MQNLSRRNAFKLAGVVGAGLCAQTVPGIASANAIRSVSLAQVNQRRTLGAGAAAFTVSAMGFGCMGLNHNRSQHPDTVAEIALVHEAVERGVTLFDTAESYGYHKNERLVGQALKGYTDRVFVSSKFGHKFVNGVQDKSREDSSPANIRHVCEEALRNLGVETLGIFYQHRADPETPVEVVAETCSQLIKEGKILHWGMCEVNAKPSAVRA